MSLLRVLLIFVVFAHLATVSGAQVITDFSKFTDSKNMLNSASHDREQEFEIDGTQINIVESEAPFNGSASQQLFGTDEFPAFTTEGYRLSVDSTEIDWDLNRLGSTNSRAGLMTSSAIPDGGTTSGDVRADGDYFYWVCRAGSVMAGMYTFDGIEQEGGLVSIGQAPDPVNDVEGVVHGLYMERVADNGGSWDLGWIDADGNDVFVQNRNTINGVDITADGTYVGLYSDMRTHTATVVFDNLSYGPVVSNSLIGDCSNDGILGVGDLVCLSTLEERDAVLGAIGTLPGDFDGDGQVAFADFLVLSANFGSESGTYAEGDTDLDGMIAFADFLILSANFGQTAAAAAVPEPSGLCIALIGLICLRGVICPVLRPRTGEAVMR